MGFYAYTRMRLVRNEAMRPENIKAKRKEKEERLAPIEDVQEEQVVAEEAIEEPTPKRGSTKRK